MLALSVLVVLNNARVFRRAAAVDDDNIRLERTWQVMQSARVVPSESVENVMLSSVENGAKSMTNIDPSESVNNATLANAENKDKSAIAATNSTADYGSFSACLLTKDDSHFLIEWLAYHYHTLRLKHLIVAVDPNSKTSPSFIFEKWRNHGLMTIEQVTDVDFFNNSKTNQTGVDAHRYRQKKFYGYCLKKLKDVNRTWTLMIDVDEYLSYNTYTNHNVMTTDISTPGTFLSFLNDAEIKAPNETLHDLQKPCIMMPRLRYGSVESTTQEVNRNVPPAFNGTAFQTLRYRKYGNPRARKVYGAGKTIIDVSRISKKEMNPSNPHRPVSKCTRDVFLKPTAKVAFVVRHYLGSLEQFFFRSDGRQADEESIQIGMKSQHVRNYSVL